MFNIETDHPIPSPRVRIKNGARAAIRALSLSNVGASVFFPSVDGRTPKSLAVSINSMANSVGGNGWYTLRKVEGGVRIWKLAEPSIAKATQQKGDA